MSIYSLLSVVKKFRLVYYLAKDEMPTESEILLFFAPVMSFY